MAKKNDLSEQIRYETAIMRKMIALYCRGNHRLKDGSKLKKGELCSECEELLDYALTRIDNCPVKDTKDFCSNCEIHCYQATKREQIRVVMRYSGPRMMLHAPITAIRHVIRSSKKKPRK